MSKETKLVIVIRHDLRMGRGKEIAQAGHASIAWLTRRLTKDKNTKYSVHLSLVEQEWLNSSFRKICLIVRSEEELLDIYQKALVAGLECNLITDAGYTVVEPGTKTCLAIGPDYCDKIDKITGHLQLA